MICPVSASTAAEVNRRRRRRVADAMTVSSTPTRAAASSLVGVVDRLLHDRGDRRPQGLPAHAQPAGQPRHRSLDCGQPSRSPLADPVGSAPGGARPDRSARSTSWHRTRNRDTPRPACSTTPSPGPTPPPARHPTPPGAAPQTRALTPQSAQNTVCPPGDPRLHHQLAGLETLGDNRQTEHAETRKRTSHNHQGPPDSWTE